MHTLFNFCKWDISHHRLQNVQTVIKRFLMLCRIAKYVWGCNPRVLKSRLFGACEVGQLWAPVGCLDGGPQRRAFPFLQYKGSQTIWLKELCVAPDSHLKIWSVDCRKDDVLVIQSVSVHLVSSSFRLSLSWKLHLPRRVNVSPLLMWGHLGAMSAHSRQDLQQMTWSIAVVDIKLFDEWLDTANNPSEIARRCCSVRVTSMMQSIRLLKLGLDSRFMMLQALQMREFGCSVLECLDSSFALLDNRLARDWVWHSGFCSSSNLVSAQ